MSPIRRIFGHICELIFPPRCVICKAEVKPRDALCPHCLRLFSDECHEAEHGAADPSEPDIYLTYYRGWDPSSPRITERLIYTFKHRRVRTLTDFFARDLSSRIMQYLTVHCISKENCVITYIPRSERGLRQYGFDQAYDLSRQISYYTGISHIKAFARHGGVEQKALDAAQRADNTQNSLYTTGADVRGLHVIIIDDVTTSGSTLGYASVLLTASGAKDTLTAVIARTKRA